jgi:hypothetical protein
MLLPAAFALYIGAELCEDIVESLILDVLQLHLHDLLFQALVLDELELLDPLEQGLFCALALVPVHKKN